MVSVLKAVSITNCLRRYCYYLDENMKEIFDKLFKEPGDDENYKNS